MFGFYFIFLQTTILKEYVYPSVCRCVRKDKNNKLPESEETRPLERRDTQMTKSEDGLRERWMNILTVDYLTNKL